MYDKFAIPEEGSRRRLLANAALEKGLVVVAELGGGKAPEREEERAAADAGGDGQAADPGGGGQAADPGGDGQAALRAGRAAAAARAWGTAFERLSAADAA